jgi:hypothetical protein
MCDLVVDTFMMHFYNDGRACLFHKCACLNGYRMARESGIDYLTVAGVNAVSNQLENLHKPLIEMCL